MSNCLLSVGSQDNDLSWTLPRLCIDLCTAPRLFRVQSPVGQPDWDHIQRGPDLQDPGAREQGCQDCE